MGINPALAIVEGLTKGVREALPFFKSLAETDLSANKIIETVREAGLKVQRSDSLKLIRHLRETVTASNYIKAVRDNFLPNPEKFGESVTHILRNYSYEVRVTGNHAMTGEKVTKWVTISTNDVLTKDQVYNYAADIAEGESESGQVVDYAMTVTNALRAPGVTY